MLATFSIEAFAVKMQRIYRGKIAHQKLCAAKRQALDRFLCHHCQRFNTAGSFCGHCGKTRQRLTRETIMHASEIPVGPLVADAACTTPAAAPATKGRKRTTRLRANTVMHLSTASSNNAADAASQVADVKAAALDAQAQFRQLLLQSTPAAAAAVAAAAGTALGRPEPTETPPAETAIAPFQSDLPDALDALISDGTGTAEALQPQPQVASVDSQRIHAVAPAAAPTGDARVHKTGGSRYMAMLKETRGFRKVSSATGDTTRFLSLF